jgi:outer membrane lipoprotein carrier protein
MKRLPLALLMSLLLSPAAWAADKRPDPLAPGLSGFDSLKALLERVRVEQKSLKTMEARFVQKQESSLLAKPEESTGTFSYAAPNRVRWEYTSPNPISVVIAGEEMTTWYRDLKRADKLKIGRYSNQVFKYLGASGSLQTLLDYFRVNYTRPAKKGDPYRLEMIPKFERITRRLKGMTLWIDGERFLPTRLRYIEAGGDTVEYAFKDVKINSAIPNDRFVLKLPEGVETRVIDLDRKSGASGKPASPAVPSSGGGS